MRISEPLRKIGQTIQQTPTRLKNLWHNRHARRIIGHTLLLILALAASPYLLACWRIALYGDQANQGALIILIILIIYGKDICHEWLESKHETTSIRTTQNNTTNTNTRRRKRNKALRGRNH